MGRDNVQLSLCLLSVAMYCYLKYWELANPRGIPASLVCGLARWDAELELPVDLLGDFP